MRLVIDTRDGAGVQVFQAASKDEMIMKLATAQEHATRKIRDLSKRLKILLKAREAHNAVPRR
jgi:hypothetical protein